VVLSQYGGPAFVRRGREVQLALDAQVEACRRKREEWLEFVRLPLGTLFALAGSAAALEEFLDNPQQLQTLTKLMDEIYLLEKECALGSSRLARQGFQRLNPLDPEDFLRIMPLLPVP
jgi:hypothetical protein